MNALPASLRTGLSLALCCGSMVRLIALEVPLTVKECAGVGITNWPATVVVPLPAGQFRSLTNFTVVAPSGEGVPVQASSLEQWASDGSLRHLLLRFPVTVTALGNATYTLRDGAPVETTVPVTLTETATNFTINTGPMRFVVPRNSGRLLNGLWLDRDANGLFAPTEMLVSDHPQNGGVFAPRAGAGLPQYDAERTNLTAVVEEPGPLRAVIRLASPTRFQDTNHHAHGFAVRLYAYAGLPWLKVDYQLQNSDKTVVRSWPLYFESLDINFHLNLTGAVAPRFGLETGAVFPTPAGHGARFLQERHDRFRIIDAQTQAVLRDSGTLPSGVGSDGFVDATDAQWGLMAVVRQCWQTWPNGLQVDALNKLSVQVFPAGSAQWFDGSVSPSGLYWLEDMQHVVKETLLVAHQAGLPAAELVRLARTFQFPPVVVVPADHYRQTRATLDLGGVIPPTNAIPEVPDARQPSYDSYWFDPADPYYGAGWVNFRDPEPGYRNFGCTPGGWPYSGAGVVASGNPADFFAACDAARGEINVRPESMADYRHGLDWPQLQLTENPYCGGTWRIFEGHGIPTIAAPRLPGTGTESAYGSRDDQHGWFYHVSDAYWLTGDPWLRDWYSFVAEFRRTRLDRVDPWPDTCSRATGHALSHALHAYRVTGDPAILDRFAEHIRRYLKPEQDPLYGDQREEAEASGGGFQTGYLMRCLVNYLEAVRTAGRTQEYAEGFNYLSGLMEWNRLYGNFPYYFNARTETGSASSGTALTLVDPQAWYYWHTGRRAYWDQLQQFMQHGINGGETPYGQFDQWTGQFEGRYYLFVEHTPRPDTNAPLPATGVQAVPGGGKVLLKWIAPADAARYHIVWGFMPITANSTLNPNTLNWWAANAIGPDLMPQAGQTQRVVISPGSNAPIYAALFSFDGADNQSALSTVVSTAGVPPDTRPPRLQTHPVFAWSCPRCPTNGVAVFYRQAGVDDVDPEVTIQYSPPSGSLFRPGTNVVQCVGSDFAGNSVTSSFPVIVFSTPALASMSRAGAELHLDLPMGCVHYLAQRASSLTPVGNWTPVTTHVMTNAGQRFLQLPVQSAPEYFRLSNSAP